MDKLLLIIILIKEALDHKYLAYEYYLEHYDKNVSYIIDNEDKLNACSAIWLISKSAVTTRYICYDCGYLLRFYEGNGLLKLEEFQEAYLMVNSQLMN